MLEHRVAVKARRLIEEYADLAARADRIVRAIQGAGPGPSGAWPPIDFETTETRIIFGRIGRFPKIRPTRAMTLTRLLKSGMLCANVATARFLQDLELPGLVSGYICAQGRKSRTATPVSWVDGMTLTRKKGTPTPEDLPVRFAEVPSAAPMRS